MLNFLSFKRIQEIFRKIAINMGLIFEQENGRNEFCKICGRKVPCNDFSEQFQDEDKLSSRCLYCNKKFIKARERVPK
ncbi:hypothetical protein [Candidatus Cetobacterium colombiensis]|uniref:Uncharacterized protein n=1 Tax=Candidatus Cetobacterium colombiensis TaxID=3073100 RepID=A0ABU4W8Y9_9FUSO|nr:hypothetical protein [Candidatus Cetobacterium colombiensis]MDX8335996.1 hypothetical protein [Candidatus Cetobacterium colombiensis]